MRFSVTGRHLTVPENTRQQIERKLRPLERLLDDSAVSAQCVIWRERQIFVCELTVHARGDHMLHGLGRDGRLLVAASAAIAKVEQQAQRLKDRWKTRRRAGAARGAATAPLRSEPVIVRVPDAPPRIVRARRSEVKPMSLDDAVLHLSHNGQTFIVFRQAESNAVTILYRRPDGDFGLIEP